MNEPKPMIGDLAQTYTNVARLSSVGNAVTYEGTRIINLLNSGHKEASASGSRRRRRREPPE